MAPAASPAPRGGEARPIALSLSGVGLSFKRRTGLLGHETLPVLRGVNLDIGRGETLGLVGRNGCGKSTLLRVMAGILRPDVGQVEVAAGLTRAVLALGLGFRDDLTGRDNALLSAMLQGASRHEARENLPKIREFSELGPAMDRQVATYSSGMRARLGFSTALVSRVDILLIDEVLAVGDGAFRQKAAAALKERIRGEQTVVLVSHNLGEIRDLADRVVWIEAGEVHAEGAAEEILPRYRQALGLA